VATRALSHRDRSRRELDQRLEQAGIAAQERSKTIATLERIGYVDDARFAVSRAGVLAARGYGDEAIRHDLAGRGIGVADRAAAIAGLEPEGERAAALLARHGPGRKTVALLIRRGFDHESVEAAAEPDVAEG
jgi:regulatory protein